MVPLAGGYGLVATALNSVLPPGCENAMLPGVTLPLKVKNTVPVAPGVPTGVAPRFAVPNCHSTKLPVPGIPLDPFGDQFDDVPVGNQMNPRGSIIGFALTPTGAMYSAFSKKKLVAVTPIGLPL